MDELKKGKARAFIFFLASIAVFILVMALKLHVRHRILEIGYKISREDSTRRELLQQKRQLDLELEYLKSPEKIREAFSEFSSMKIQAPEQIVRLRSPGR